MARRNELKYYHRRNMSQNASKLSEKSNQIMVGDYGGTLTHTQMSIGQQ